MEQHGRLMWEFGEEFETAWLVLNVLADEAICRPEMEKKPALGLEGSSTYLPP